MAPSVSLSTCDLLHEHLGADDDAGDGDADLQEDAVAVRHHGVAVEVQRLRLAAEIALALHGLPDVVAVEHEQRGRQEPVEQLHVQEAGAHGQRVGDHEVAQVAAHDGLVHRHLARAPAAQPEDDDRGAGDEHREAREHERRAQDGAHADLVGGRAAGEDDGDDGHERLGKRRADRGEDAADGAFAEVVAAPEPLDPVGEELSRDEDEAEREDEEEDGHRRGRIPEGAGRPRRPAPVGTSRCQARFRPSPWPEVGEDEVEHEGGGGDPEQPADLARLALHDADEHVGDEAGADAVGDAVGERHDRHRKDGRQAEGDVREVDAPPGGSLVCVLGLGSPPW